MASLSSEPQNHRILEAWSAFISWTIHMVRFRRGYATIPNNEKTSSYSDADVRCGLVSGAETWLVLIDQDGSGPGGSNQMAMLALLQAPQVEVLGITMVTGDAWRDEETPHTLRMLELTGHGNVPVARGAVCPLVRSEQETRLAVTLNGGPPPIKVCVAGGVGAVCDDAGGDG